MKAIANIPNWHRYLYGLLAALLAIFTAITADPRILPPPLEDVHLWAPFVILVIGAILAQMPRAQLPAGPGAPPVLSPPPKDASGTIQGLVDGHALPPRQ